MKYFFIFIGQLPMQYRYLTELLYSRHSYLNWEIMKILGNSPQPTPFSSHVNAFWCAMNLSPVKHKNNLTTECKNIVNIVK